MGMPPRDAESPRILGQVERICASDGLRRSRQLQALLRYVVERAIEQEHRVLKEYTLGVEVLGRSADYEPRLDPIVRVQMRNLRARLRKYYQTKGGSDKVLIELPEGAYVPRITLDSEAERAAAHPRPGATLAVMPFVQVGISSEREHLAVGLSDALISTLAQSHSLRVLARASSFQFAERPANIQDAGVALHATHLLDGQVEERGGTVRATAKLFDAATGEEIWTGEFDLHADAFSRLTKDVAAAVVDALPVSLSQQDRDRIHRLGTSDAASYDACLQAWQGFHLWSDDGLLRARDRFQEAVRLDPRNAQAHAGLSLTWWALRNNGVINGAQWVVKARQAAERAIAFDLSCGKAHTALGLIRAAYEFRWAEAEEACREGIRLSPSFSLGHHALAQVVLLPQRRFDEALAEMQLARDLDPLSVHVVGEIGFAMYLANRCEEALALLTPTIGLHPDLWFLYEYRAWAFDRLERHDEAWQDARRGHELNPGNEMTAVAGYMAARAGRLEAASAFGDKLGESSPNFLRALPALGSGQTDQAFDLMEKALDLGAPSLRYAAAGLGLEHYWDHPRFDSLRRRMNLPDPLAVHPLG